MIAFRTPTKIEKLVDEIHYAVAVAKQCPPHLLLGYSHRGQWGERDRGDEDDGDTHPHRAL